MPLKLGILDSVNTINAGDKMNILFKLPTANRDQVAAFLRDPAKITRSFATPLTMENKIGRGKDTVHHFATKLFATPFPGIGLVVPEIGITILYSGGSLRARASSWKLLNQSGALLHQVHAPLIPYLKNGGSLAGEQEGAADNNSLQISIQGELRMVPLSRPGAYNSVSTSSHRGYTMKTKLPSQVELTGHLEYCVKGILPPFLLVVPPSMRDCSFAMIQRQVRDYVEHRFPVKLRKAFRQFAADEELQ
jgi:hypothetical protein